MAWVLAQGTDIVPLVGARRTEQMDEMLGSSKLTLSPDDLAALEQMIPKNAAAGDRYHAHGMAGLDSERGS